MSPFHRFVNYNAVPYETCLLTARTSGQDRFRLRDRLGLIEIRQCYSDP
jgi:hypothetical protein